MILIKEKMLDGSKRELELRNSLDLTNNEHKSLKIRPLQLLMKKCVYLSQVSVFSLSERLFRDEIICWGLHMVSRLAREHLSRVAL